MVKMSSLESDAGRSSGAASSKAASVAQTKRRGQGGSSVGGQSSAAAKKKPKTASKRASGLRCSMCGDIPGLVKWGATRIEKCEEIPMGPACFRCKETHAPFRARIEDFEEFADWAKTEEGQREVASAATTRARRGDDVRLEEEVSSEAARGATIQRELWIANALEFKQLFNRDPGVKQPRVPVVTVPVEGGGGVESVFCFTVDHRVYALRKLVVWAELGVRRQRFEMPRAAPAFHAQSQGYFDRAVSSQQAQWEQQILFGSAQVLTVEAFKERCSPAPVAAKGGVSPAGAEVPSY